ncbi:MAG TPA: pesticin C-terminus-like muramidase [Stellaceae bacterium]|nr:pesticin C-terminus-like muramidase [Stellaceae bacterium]
MAFENGSTVNWAKIGEWEGNRLRGYVPENAYGSVLGVSGVTIGMGVDLGQMDPSALDALDITPSLKETLSPYLGLKGDAALEALQAPLTITQNESDHLNAAVQAAKVDLVRQRYDAAVGSDGARFDDLPEAAQTVITSVAFQWGSIWARSSPPDIPMFWQAVISRDWEKTISVLRGWALKPWHGAIYRTRRNAEADYLASA